MHIAIINGANLNLLGKREPTIYGTSSMEQVLIDLQQTYPDVYFEYHQSNHEGDLIDWIQQFGVFSTSLRIPFDGIILNAGGYTHTSIALRDAVVCATIPVVEVHISDIGHREPFRRVSLLTDVCAHAIIGMGINGYQQATEWIIQHYRNKEQ